jgi:two-component system sensor histidine kinase BaeS
MNGETDGRLVVQEESWWDRGRPQWWPEGEPWPPPERKGRHASEQVSWQFVRRAGCAFAFLIFLATSALAALLWLIGSALGWAPISSGMLNILRVVVIVFGSLLSAAGFVRRSIAPVRDMLEAVGRVEGGDYSTRIQERGPREIRRLVQAFNSMTTRLQANDEQRRLLLADVSHELRTPLTVIQGSLEGMLDGIYPADSAHINTALEETRVLERIISDLRTIALAEGGALRLEREPTDLVELAEDAAAAFQAQAAVRGVTLCVQSSVAGVTLSLDPTRIREVLANLLANALRYTPEGGRITIDVRQENGEARVTVEDTGSGIAPEDFPHIFDRFYKSVDSRGTGLGLAIAKNLVEVHGGEIWAESEPGAGTKMVIRLRKLEDPA